MDPLQAKILKVLLVDGRKNAAEIAKEIGISKEEVHKKYQEMKRVGIIKGATIHINYKSFGYKAVGHLLITVDPRQADQLIAHFKKIPDIYAAYSNGPKCNVRVVTALKTLQKLEEVKDEIKGKFLISDLKTSLWTDVKEMHKNLALLPVESKSQQEEVTSKIQSTVAPKKNTKIEELDLKLVEKLAENGRAPLNKIAQEIGTTTHTVKRHYTKLIKSGILKVTIQIDLTKIGYHAMAIFFITVTAQENSFSIIEKISCIPDVISIMKTSGDYDLQVYAMIKDIDHLLSIQEEISKISGITKIDLEIARAIDKWPTPRQYISTF
ncbi:MAG: Lrp/AsnC family transcriptional regulator [Candidatus Bathyarchaeota archaeon]|nr:Lrp/AsnC family transcriptional regulator [Candidatus Bathyarchaeota archaeon]